MKTRTVMAEFTYHDDSIPFTTQHAWPCGADPDGELIVKGHAHKTGAIKYRYIVEDKSYEEIIKEAAGKTEKIAKEKDPA